MCVPSAFLLYIAGTVKVRQPRGHLLSLYDWKLLSNLEMARSQEVVRRSWVFLLFLWVTYFYVQDFWGEQKSQPKEQISIFHPSSFFLAAIIYRHSLLIYYISKLALFWKHHYDQFCSNHWFLFTIKALKNGQSEWHYVTEKIHRKRQPFSPTPSLKCSVGYQVICLHRKEETSQFTEKTRGLL